MYKKSHKNGNTSSVLFKMKLFLTNFLTNISLADRECTANSFILGIRTCNHCPTLTGSDHGRRVPNPKVGLVTVGRLW